MEYEDIKSGSLQEKDDEPNEDFFQGVLPKRLLQTEVEITSQQIRRIGDWTTDKTF